jgi:hypothetical protein
VDSAADDGVVLWVSERLRMGYYTRVTQSIRRAEHQSGRKINQIKRKLERLESLENA